MDAKTLFAGTTRGYTSKDRKMWLAGKVDDKFLIVVCEHPGNLLARPTYKAIASFGREADRDFAIAAFQDALNKSEGKQSKFMSKPFPWGHVIERFSYDFDGNPLEIVKYHPYKTKGCTVTREPNESITEFHIEECRESWNSLDAAVIGWIVRRRLGLNQGALVAGIFKALDIV